MNSKIKIKKGQIEDYAVQKTGDQTIDGRKNFTTNPRVPHTSDPGSAINLEQAKGEITDKISEITLQKVAQKGSSATNLVQDFIITGNGINVKGTIAITREGARLSGPLVALDADEILQIRAGMQTGIHTPSFFVRNPDTNTFILNKGALTALTSQEQTKALIANDASGKALITREYLEEILGNHLSLNAVLTAGNTSTKSIILEKPSGSNDLAVSADGFEFATYGDDFDNLTLKWTTSGDGELFGTEIELPKKSGTLAVLEDISTQVAQQISNNTVLSSEATLVLTADKTVNYFANTGGATTWTLPPVSGNTGKHVIIVNKGSDNIYINSHEGNLELFDGAPLNAMPLIPGATYGLYCDGAHWTGLY